MRSGRSSVIRFIRSVPRCVATSTRRRFSSLSPFGLAPRCARTALARGVTKPALRIRALAPHLLFSAAQ
jgi:hypothetical protein